MTLHTDVTGLTRKTHRAMACQWEIILWGGPNTYLRDAASQAFEAVDRTEALLSVYRPDSEISILNANGAEMPVKLSPPVFRILEYALALFDFTNGAFDITTGPLVDLWGFKTRSHRKPTQEEIESALKLTGKERLLLDASASTVSFDQQGVEVNLGAFGKGVGVDIAVETLQECRIPGALIHAGTSTVSAIGHQPDGGEWVVGVRDPNNAESRVWKTEVCNESLSSSGSYEQFFEIDGERFGHVIDPRTGWPTRKTLSATVICESAAASDALATAALIMGEDNFQKLCEQEEGLRAYFINNATSDSPPQKGD